MKADIRPEHQWLEKFAGVWAPLTGPDTPADMFSEDWTETGRMLVGAWLVVEGSGSLPGTNDPAGTLMTIGYDPAKGKFVGSWVGSMMTHHWVYEGGLNDDDALELECQGPDFETPGAYLTYRDTYSFNADGSRTLTASVKDEDGVWKTFMTTTYLRKA